MLANDIDIMYQIRHMVQNIKFRIELIHTQPSKIDGVYVPTPEEALLLSCREKATQYYSQPDATFPSIPH